MLSFFRPTAYDAQIAALHRELNIPRDYSRRGLPLQPNCLDLVAISCGKSNKSIEMSRTTARQWELLHTGALDAGFKLTVLSGYRSLEDQAALIRAALERADSSDSIERVLMRLAAPGYSEHHTGTALDIIVPDCASSHPEIYAATNAFRWLQRNAGKYGFSMSYPRDNSAGLIFEPWHWRCDTTKA